MYNRSGLRRFKCYTICLKQPKPERDMKKTIFIILALLLVTISLQSQFDKLQYSAGMSNGYPIIPFLHKQPDDKYKLIMSLPKTSYLKYEPVIAKFEVINNDTIPLNIWDIFWTDANYLRTMRITDNLGYTYQINQSPGDMLVVYNSPDYIVQPSDTFTISMSINNWGKDNGTRILGQFGYFPSEQTYEAHFENEQLISNIVKFEVIDLNEEDNELLDLLKNKQISETKLQMYGDNPIVEHIYAKYFLNTVQDYYDFFSRYPTSFYMYYDRFMSKFYTSLFTDSKNIDYVISSIKNNIYSDQFKQFLSNDSISRRIKEILKNYKPKNKKKQK